MFGRKNKSVVTEEDVKVEKKSKRKHGFFHRLFSTLLVIVLVPVVFVVTLLVFSGVDKADSLDVIPSDFIAYVRTDRLYKTVNPLLDLEAVDVLLGEEKLSDLRNLVLSYKSAPFRDNFWFGQAASRRFDAAFYSDGSFGACLNLGFISFGSRIGPIASLFMKKIDGLSVVTENGNTFYKYEIVSGGSGQTFYLKPYHNLVLVSNSQNTFARMCGAECLDQYPSSRLDELQKKLDEDFRICCDSRRLASLYSSAEKNGVEKLLPLLDEKTLATVDVALTDRKMHVAFNLPLSVTDENTPDCLSMSSSSSAVLKMLEDTAQSYTILNLSDLEKLKDLAFDFVPAEKNIAGLWQTGETECNELCGMSLEKLLLEWSGREMAEIRLENRMNPVYVVQIKDEAKRKNVFDKVIKKTKQNEKENLRLNGSPVPDIAVPEFLQNIFECFGVKVTKPYYIVKSGYLWFSDSAENVMQVSNSGKGSAYLVNSEKFKAVSDLHKKETGASVFYDLGKNVPFFLQSDSCVSQALKLYNVGRGDLVVSRKADGSGVLSVMLEAVRMEVVPSSTSVAGFPRVLSGSTSSQLCRTNSGKSQLLFWIRDGNTLQLWNVDADVEAAREMPGLSQIVPNRRNDRANVLWAVTENGSVSLLDVNLNAAPGFPVELGGEVKCPVSFADDSLVVVTGSNVFHKISTDGKVEKMTLDVPGAVEGAPVFYKNYMACRLTGSEDCLVFVKNAFLGSESHTVVPVASGDGVKGGPAIAVKGKNFYTGFINGEGQVCVYRNFEVQKNVSSVNMEESYGCSVFEMGSDLYMLSGKGLLSKLDCTKAQVKSVRVEGLEGSGVVFTSADYNKDRKDELFLSGDNHLVYGFNSNLELLKYFPLSGKGAPVFADVDGDGKNELLVLSADNSLNAYKILKK